MAHGLLQMPRGEASFGFEVLRQRNESTKDHPTLHSQFHFHCVVGATATFDDAFPNLVKGRTAFFLVRPNAPQVLVSSTKDGTSQCDKFLDGESVHCPSALRIQNGKEFLTKVELLGREFQFMRFGR